MNILEKKLIKDVIQFRDQNKQQEIYDAVNEYLKKNQASVDLLLRLAIFFEQPPIVDEPKSIELAEKVLKNDPYNPFALIIIAFVYYYDIGEIPLKIYKQLGHIHSHDYEIQSMVEIVKSWYLKNQDEKKYVESLKKSISLCNKFTANYIDLGRYYIDHNEEKKGILLFKVGVNNIQKIYNDNDERDDLLKEFLNERIKGIFVTKWHYQDYERIINFNQREIS